MTEPFTIKPLTAPLTLDVQATVRWIKANHPDAYGVYGNDKRDEWIKKVLVLCTTLQQSGIGYIGY